jgi:hypothetical protein
MSDCKNRRHFKIGCGCGGTFACILAAILSWQTNHSIILAFVHFFCGIFYDIYWALKYLPELLERL